MRICLWIALVIMYLFIGFWVAYFLYRKSDLDFRATTNILLWPIMIIAIILSYMFHYLGKAANYISNKAERLFERLKHKSNTRRK